MYQVKRFKDVKKQDRYRDRCEYNGTIYDSKLEAKVAQDLDVQQKQGLIKSWEHHVKIDLNVYGKSICNYYIDFVAIHSDGTVEYIEVKGIEMDLWRFKWRLFEAITNHNEPESLLTVIK